MPSTAARRLFEDQIPTFMSVFDLDAETIADQETVTLVNPKFVDMEAKSPSLAHSTQPNPLRHNTIPSNPTHTHHDSTSTQTSESADSSPTTTLSTTDSASLSDPSPSSSPDSPINLIPLNNFPSTSFGTLGALPEVADMHSNSGFLAEPPRLQRPMTSPSPRRARNMKGLSIQPPFAASTSSNITLMSEPSSPSFIKPQIPGMKRKPSQLSLKTNTSDLIAKTTLEVPPSPGMPPILQRRALKHSTSSPHMLSGMKSSTFGPAGGMTFPKVLERNESGLSEVLRPMKSSMKTSFDVAITEEDSPIRTQMANRGEFEPFGENENNEDMKTPGYPDGPIAIYGDNVFLYLEPTAEEAARFDVVINCAREVNNPFEIRRQSQCVLDRLKNTAPADYSPIPDTALTNASFKTAFEYPVDDDSVETPTTPKANPLQEPEYMHVPWDHNTDIAPDLMRLCETIENRTKEGKKVLIHCQQGASRSASLIIAYGLYQKPELTVNDAYYAAQAKSKWISPNMKLMYSLQDFQKDISKKRPSPSSSSRGRNGRSPTKHRLTLSADAIDMSTAEREPKTAPLPDNSDQPQEERENVSPTRLRGNSTPNQQAVSPGPASAPPTYTWIEEVEQQTEEYLVPFRLGNLPQRPKSGHGREAASPVDPWSRPPPSPGFPSQASFGFQSMGFPRFNDQPSRMQASFDDQPVERTVVMPATYPEDEALLSPRAETMTNNPLHETPEIPSMRFMECSPSPPPGNGLFSPRATMFPRDSFPSFGRPTAVADPRSPPTRGEAPIVRSIDDLL